MEVLLVSNRSDARDWIESVSDSHLRVWHSTNYSDGLEMLQEDGQIGSAVVDYKIDHNNFDGFPIQTNGQNGSPNVHVRFDGEQYDPKIHTELLQTGIRGVFIDWPTKDLLEHEIFTRENSTFVTHKECGRVFLQGQTLSVGGISTHLPQKESGLLWMLMRAKGEVVSRDKLLIDMGWNPRAKSHTLETHMGRLRKNCSGLGLPDDSIPKLVPKQENKGYRINI